jgi:APA family basic amino acid/polyamine antiporter
VSVPDRPVALRRELGLADAVLVGLGAMLGAGVFAVFGPAAAVAGAGLLLAPLQDAVRAGSLHVFAPLVRVGAVAASLGVLLLGLVVIAVVSVADIRGAIGFSSTGVLVYYAIANASAWTLPGRARRWRRPVAALGLLGCVVLVATLPAASVLAGLALLAVGLVARAIVRRRRRKR